MAIFNDRRGGGAVLNLPTNPAEMRRASLARPDKPGQASRAYMARTQRVHNDVLAGHAAVVNPVPAVVKQVLGKPYAARDVLPAQRRRGLSSPILSGRF